MDCGSTYIKMCEMAEEIQEAWEPAEGDWIIEKDFPKIPLVLKDGFRNGSFVTEIHWGEDDVLEKDKSIWLPRLDQLQDMVGDNWIQVFHDFVGWVNVEFGTGVDEFYFQTCELFSSMEQLWLAFVMKKKYGIIVG